MNHVRVSNQLIIPVLAALIGASAAAACTAAESQLNWTPHRNSTPVDAAPASQASMPEAAAEPAAVAAATTPVAAPAAVVLPDDVPAPAPAAPALTAAAPRRRAMAPAGGPAAAAAPNAVRKALGPGTADGMFGLNVMRTPQGPITRPILAAEGPQAVAMQRAADRAVTQTAGERLGGGLAPRYAATRGPRPRIDRIAMNADGIPSVMAQQPRVGALDDAAVPGRAPATGAGATPPATSSASAQKLPTPATEAPSVTEEMPLSIDSFSPGMGGMDPSMDPSMGMGTDMGGMPGDPGDAPLMSGEGGMLLGEYPAQLHVESFYDDPYACEDDECLPLCLHHGAFCNWLRRFGQPYYGWRWYRDFTASAGATAFTNSTDLGINGNFGTNEYLNWAMPFWNAFGVGWQVGWRGTQTNFQPASIEAGSKLLEKNARTQNFVTTGFFTRAFEGRGLQGGAVYDYLSDNWFDNVDVSQIRAEISYVWGYHEAGFWSATNIGDQVGLFGPVTRQNGVASTLDLYCGFYRLQFGDANEWKVWGGGTGNGDGIVGSLLRAPLARSFALEATFTYLIPGESKVINIDGAGTTSSFSPSAWNVGANIVYYPAGRSRRSLASPYRPLFEVADNGSMIRSIGALAPTP